jgi:hypothetical protein
MRLHHYLFAMATFNFLCGRLTSSFGNIAISRRLYNKATSLFHPPYTMMSTSRSFVTETGEDPDIEKLFQANCEWVDSVNKKNQHFFQNWARASHPNCCTLDVPTRVWLSAS